MAESKTITPGIRLRVLRKKLKKNQKDMARALGISASALSRYERDRKQPDTYFLHQLRTKTGANLNWIVGGIGGMIDPRPQPEDRVEKLAREIKDKLDEIENLYGKFQELTNRKAH